MIFAREAFLPLWPEAWPLLQAHYREVAHFQDVPLEPDLAFYEAAEKAGRFRVYTARDQGALVGYAAFFTLRNPHYMSLRQAVMDVVYVDPRHRGRMLGYKLIRWCDDRLREDGYECTHHHLKAKAGLDYGDMLVRQGYELVEKIYVKRLQVIAREQAA